MIERPILFSGPMSKAVNEGLKTQTRRVILPQPNHRVTICPTPCLDGSFSLHEGSDEPLDYIRCPYGVVGDRLWGREGWRTLRKWDDLTGRELGQLGENIPIEYQCDRTTRDWPARQTSPLGRYRHARFMPRWASRLTLEITGVRVDRLQDISAADVEAEGFIKLPATGRIVLTEGAQYFGNYWNSAREAYRDLWDAINAKRPGCAWRDNPWVWALTFRRV